MVYKIYFSKKRNLKFLHGFKKMEYNKMNR